MRGKFIYLFISLLALLLLHPLFVSASSFWLNLLLSLILFASIYEVSYDSKHTGIAVVLGLPWLILSWLRVLGLDLSVVLINILAIIFYIYVIWELASHLIKATKVTSNVLFGAVSVYLLIGISFADLYTFVNLLKPGSFAVTTNTLVNISYAWQDFVYYSYSTLTTLGHGDIVPVTVFTRALTSLEAVMGTLYLTVLIARLMGLYIAQHYNRK